MNIVNFNDDGFKNTVIYQNFMKENPGTGNLKVRASSASGAIPIKGLKVVVSSIINNIKVIFYEGVTDDSGLTGKINLPAPSLSDNMNVPKSIVYEVETTYVPDNSKVVYNVNMYDGICVVQNINIVPEVLRDSYGS